MAGVGAKFNSDQFWRVAVYDGTVGRFRIRHRVDWRRVTMLLEMPLEDSRVFDDNQLCVARIRRIDGCSDLNGANTAEPAWAGAHQYRSVSAHLLGSSHHSVIAFPEHRAHDACACFTHPPVTQIGEGHMMRTLTRAAHAAGIALVVLGAASSAQAQFAQFTEIRDAVPSKYFSAATTHPLEWFPNLLIIGLEDGVDPVTSLPNNFVAWSGNRSAMDTISFKVTAPEGFYVALIYYQQEGTASSSRQLTAAGSTTWVVANTPASVGTFLSDPGLVVLADLTGQRLTSVPVSITASLFASVGAISITDAKVYVVLAPLE
ncbi:MAG TPA: hypothetical protein VKE51_28965 [Vicinamibacterales bacterium]|nr:hypothetical protein [Vicinamibacterales bacterium]